MLQRGIEANGVNTYEDSDMYVAPPEPLPVFSNSSGSGSNSTDGGGNSGEWEDEEGAEFDSGGAAGGGGSAGKLGSLLTSALSAVGRESPEAAAARQQVSASG